MSELNISAALAPELPRAAGIGPRDPSSTTAGSATAASSAPNPFAALLSGVLKGAQPLAQAAAPLAGEPLPEVLTTAPAEPAGALALPAGPAPLPTLPNLDFSPATGGVSGSQLPSTGNNLPPAVPGEVTAKMASAIPSSETGDTPPPAAPRPAVSLTDLDYSRQLAAPAALATGSPPEGARSAALAFAGRAFASSRAAPADSTGPAPVPPINLAALQPAGTETVPALISADLTELPQSATDLLRAPLVIPGAGAEAASRQLAAFATAGEHGSSQAASAADGATAAGNTGSATLLNRLGSTTLPGLQPLGDAGAFSAGLADRLLMLGGPGAHSARLKLYPEHLGELKVDIRIDDGTAEVRFSTTTPQAREAIEGSLPRLRELFADQGIQLTRVHVDAGAGQTGHTGSESQRRMPEDAPIQRDSDWRPGGRATPVSGLGLPAITGNANRLLDVWA